MIILIPKMLKIILTHGIIIGHFYKLSNTIHPAAARKNPAALPEVAVWLDFRSNFPFYNHLLPS